MHRRRFLVAGASFIAGAGAGCSGRLLPTDEPAPSGSPTQTPTETGTETSTQTSTATQSPTHTPAGPFTFAFIMNRDDTTHHFTFAITSVKTDSVVFKRTGDIAPDPQKGIEFSDEWLEEAGPYRVRCSIEDGGETIAEVEVDEMWACNNTVEIRIRDDGDVASGIPHGDGQRC